MITFVQKWFKEQKALQDKVKPTELPVLTVGMISLKIQVYYV